jgi:hypothetical protein
MEYLYILYFNLIRPRLECASVEWNSVTSTDANTLDRIQQKFTSVCFIVFFFMIPRNVLLHELGLLFYGRGYIILTHSLLFAATAALNLALPFQKILAIVFLTAISGSSHSSALVPLTNTVLLLGAPVLPTWWLNISIYLHL